MWKKILPGIFGVIGLVVWKRFTGGGARDQKAAKEQLAETAETLRSRRSSMSGQEFERFMAEVLRNTGYEVDMVGGPGDQGVDLLVRVGRKRVAVQCKLHGKPVGRAAVADVYAGAKHHGAKQAWLVAPGGFTPGAMELAESTNVKLLDLAAIRGLLQKD
jgi:HJR/Mrr/RecB family endonuclease